MKKHGLDAKGGRGVLALLASAGAAMGLFGCVEADSYLLDPSVVGRWERTPTTVPILNRIGSIEGTEDEFVTPGDVTEADLVPDVSEYRLGPGDRLQVILYDIPDEGRAVPYERFIDPRGIVELPQLGQVRISGLTSAEAEEAIKEAMKALIANPLAYVEVMAPRQKRYSVLGAVQASGPYLLPTADFRLLEAMTVAGGVSEAPEYIYIIRQVPLSEAVRATPPTGATTPPAPKPGESLLDVLKDLGKPPEGAPADDKPHDPEMPRPDAPKPSEAPKPSASRGAPAGTRAGASPAVFQPAGGQPPARAPIDLIEPGRPATQPAQPERAAERPTDDADSSWVYLDGRWVKVRRPGGGRTPAEAMSSPGKAASELVTQRVIRVPVKRLLQGDARVNVVIRPGDVIRVPPGPTGFIYVGGQVARGGSYQMADGMTLMRLIVSAGGFGQLSVPEKIDLTRMLGNDRQATIRLNGRAIFEGTNPDVYLKSNDIINVGSSFWATPLAVIRNGFRFSYGFGFIADRNFGNDLFGAPPVNAFGQ
ncbi:MAG: polysaccharide biosynthesis/export family protein [Phycisphaerae bacterium]|nr:polysaccharide biosynthesis/export family protein [Phycisphaerae bacterium]